MLKSNYTRQNIIEFIVRFDFMCCGTDKVLVALISVRGGLANITDSTLNSSAFSQNLGSASVIGVGGHSEHPN